MLSTITLLIACSNETNDTAKAENVAQTEEQTTTVENEEHSTTTEEGTTTVKKGTSNSNLSKKPSDENMAFYCKKLNNKIAVGAWNAPEGETYKDALDKIGVATLKGEKLIDAEIRISPLNRKDKAATGKVAELMLNIKPGTDPLDYVYRLKQIFYDKGKCACVQLSTFAEEPKGMHILEHVYYYDNGKLASIFDIEDKEVPITDELRAISEENLTQFKAIRGL